MTPTHNKVKSLSGTIFRSVLIFTITVLLVFAVVVTTLFYFSYEHDAEEQLISQALETAQMLDSSDEEADAILAQQAGTRIRYTHIDTDGTVLFDSVADESSMANHADRPEVAEAASDGAASIQRYSETLQTDTIYAAVRLDDGTVLRLAETRSSLASFIGMLFVPMILTVLIAALLVLVLSRVLTKRIMKPIDALDFSEPLENEIYLEMDPLLERIDEQQHMLKRQTEELSQAASLRRDFSSNVSHEMKTPLQVISGYAELMKNDMVKPEDRQKFSSIIYDEAQAMRSLINDVLTLSRLDESAVGDMNHPIDLLASARLVAERLSLFADKEGVSIKVEGERAIIAGSDTLVEEMLYNLIENGIRYNHQGGCVTMTIGNDADGPVVHVSDTGQGIPKDMQDKIFERFFRVDKSRSKETGGTGLGLAIVKHAVIYHGGTIQVESELGEGATFVLHFPKCEGLLGDER